MRRYGGRKSKPHHSRLRKGTDWKAVLERQMRAAGLPEPEREYLFHEARQWRFDYAWVEEGFALEFEGGIWLQTKEGRSKGHAHPLRFIKDCEKYNEAALYGWFVLRMTGRWWLTGKPLLG